MKTGQKNGDRDGKALYKLMTNDVYGKNNGKLEKIELTGDL